MTSPLKYIVLRGRLPGEGMWCTADNYRALVAQVKDAFGDDFEPIFKYMLPSNPKANPSPPDGNCAIIIDDEDDFGIWLNGCVPVPHHRCDIDDIYSPPVPLTKKLFVFQKNTWIPSENTESEEYLLGHTDSSAASPKVLHAENDVVKVPLHPLLPPLLELKLGLIVVLRHSNAEEAILFSSRSVSGAGEGHWGVLVRKAQSAWGVRRPSFRYLDLDAGVTAMNIFNSRDYMFWSRGVGRERIELVVLEHLFVPDRSPEDAIAKYAAECRVQLTRPFSSIVGDRNAEAGMSDVTVTPVGTGSYTATVAATVRGVQHGLFGPTFTTAGNIPPPHSLDVNADQEELLEHHKKLLDTLIRSGLA